MSVRERTSCRRIHLLRRNVLLFFLMRFGMTSFAVLMPALVALFTECGFSLTQIMILQGVFSLLLGLSVFPSGHLADSIGRKPLVVAGAVFLVIGCAGYCVAETFMEFLVLEVVLAFGFAFMGAAEYTLLFESLRELKQGRKFKALLGRGFLLGCGAAATYGVIGGFIAAYGLRTGAYVNFALMLSMLGFALMLTEPKRVRRAKTRSTLRHLGAVAHQSLWTSRRLRWLILFPALMFSINQSAVWLYTPYFELTGLNLTQFGFVFGFFNVVAGLAAWSAHRVEGRLGEAKGVLLVVCLLSASFLLPGCLIYVFSFLLCAPQQWIRGYGDVIFSAYLQEEAPADLRATVSSIRGALGNVLNGGAYFGVAWIVSMLGVTQTFVLIGTVALLLGFGLYALLWQERVQ